MQDRDVLYYFIVEMGASDSKPFNDLTNAEVALAVLNLGDCYQTYGESLIQSGVDGRFLDSLSDTELEETLKTLKVSNRLHRRVLLKELNKARQSTNFVASTYDYSPSTPLSDLDFYQKATDKCFREYEQTAILAGVHLVLDNGNQLSLDTKVLKDVNIVTEKQHRPRETSFCSRLVRETSNRHYYKLLFPFEFQKDFIADPRPLTYTGYILRDESGKRIGILCMLDRCSPSELLGTDRKTFLQHLALDIEVQLKLRKQLVARQRSKEHNTSTDNLVEAFKVHIGSEFVVSADGPIKPVLNSQVTESMSQMNPSQLAPGKRASHKLPKFQNMSTEAERAHLPLNFFDCIEEMSCPRPPITKNDMECSAIVESLALTDINPEEPIAIYLKEMVKMATQVFGFPNAEITFRNHETAFCLAGYGESAEISACFNHFPTLKRNKDGTQFLWTMPRALSICNYVIASAGSFVVQDLAADESFQGLAAKVPFQCYAGTAIKDSCGRPIAVLCLYDAKPRPDFETAHEIQLEQLACLISQSIENWALKRSVERLENKRKIVNRGKDKQGPPKDEVTLVVTDIEGYNDLWDASFIAMQEGQRLHDHIIKELCAKHFGHEVATEGHSFALAFHDPVDAFGFALQAQISLNVAPWSDDLLCLHHAKEEASAFRGLRVKMAIHEGNVGPFREGQPDEVNYTGETMNIAKSLLQMTHGGQILATSETWDVASYFMGSMLSFPQVLDHGSHVICKGQTTRDGIITKRITQLVPAKLAYDYFTARKLSAAPEQERHCVAVHSHIQGRQFPPISSLKKISPSFHDAPFLDNQVTIAFVNLSSVSDHEASSVVNLIGLLLDGMPDFGGYQCQSEMLAFHRPLDAILFGLHLQKELTQRKSHGDGPDGSHVARHMTYACIDEPFLTMGPHRTTGRADYFGKIVNRAARLGKAVALGSVCFGVVGAVGEGDATMEMERIVDTLVHPSIESHFTGKKRLKGVPEQISVFEYKSKCDCPRSHIEPTALSLKL